MRRAVQSVGVMVLLAGSLTPSTAQQVTVGQTVTISRDAATVPHGESFYAINPRNPRNHLATAVRIGPDGAGSAAYVSHDGGKSWSRVVLPASAKKVTTGWDAIAYFDGRGIAYFGANDGDGLYISRSTDNGRTWSTATLLAGNDGFDRQYMGFDVTGRYAGRIYAGASVSGVRLDGQTHASFAIASSDDSARTFKQPELITSTTDESVFTVTNIVVTPDGTLILPLRTRAVVPTDGRSLWTSQAGAGTAPPQQWHFRVAVSGDGGQSYSVSPRVMSFQSVPDAFRGDLSQGNGNTAIDLSLGPNRGRIYHVWVDYANDRNDIRVISSGDNGKSWSSPVTVNDGGATSDQGNPTIAVNNKGVVGVIWNDRRRHKDSCYDLYFAASLDGGQTFLPNVASGREPTCPLARGNWTPRARISPYPRTEKGRSIEGQGLNVLMISTRFPGGGDTQGLDADGEGVFHAGWIDGSSGVMQLATTPFRVEGQVKGSTVAVATRDTTPEVETAPSGENDVSLQVKLVAEQCRFDWTENTFSCLMHLENRSPTAVGGPFAVELQNMRVNLTGFAVTGSDNQKPGAGARWTFKPPRGAKALGPGARTEGRRFTWRFDGIPPNPEYPFMMFKVVSTGPTA